ncbi:MAG TPA: sialidase family protein [Candidatus Limnocylindria bacterium]|nr:sialidase family protein [Candidatus Limnocylindria bacterium]
MVSRGSLPRSFAVLASIAVLALAVAPALAEDEGEINRPVEYVSHNGMDLPLTGATWAAGPALKNGDSICTAEAGSTPDVNLSCEGTGPHNETTIAVNPANTENMIAGTNDYQISINPGGHVAATTLSRATVTFDGGQTWTVYPIRVNSSYASTGDPSVAFDASGNAYYATLGFRFAGAFNGVNPDVVVASSHDGGIHWTSQTIAHGSGSFTSVGDLLDKEYVTAWGDGNALVTFGDFRLGHKGATLSGSVYASVTHDAGATWSTPVVISGDELFAFVSMPVATADGRVFAAWENFTHFDTGRDDYEVVELDPATGQRIAGPFTVAELIDGYTDYPIAEGRQTYQDSMFRSWSAGNITADPTDGDHLAVIWSDMRNSQLPAPEDPYEAVTNSDVVVSQSFDGGRTWSAEPVALTIPRDQFQPWGAYDTSGILRIGYFDRSYDGDNHLYGYTLATETSAGSLDFSTEQLSTALSDPTKNNEWFAATEEDDFPRATTFLGDYSNIAANPDGGVVAVWTDLRNDVTFAGTTGHDQDMYFRAAP